MAYYSNNTTLFNQPGIKKSYALWYERFEWLQPVCSIGLSTGGLYLLMGCLYPRLF